MRVRTGPTQRCSRIFDGGRERVLGCQAVVDREHVRSNVATEQATDAIVCVEVAIDEPAAMKEDEQGLVGARIEGSVVASSQGYLSLNLEIGDRPDSIHLAGEDRGQPTPLPPCIVGAQGLEGRLASALEQRQRELHLGGKRLTVDEDRGLSRETDLGRGWKCGKRLCDTVCGALTQRGS
jgi:hypothetical protein